MLAMATHECGAAIIQRTMKGQLVFFRRHARAIAVGVTAIAVGGAFYGIVSGTSSSSSVAPSTATTANAGSNARSGPASGGTSGKVASVSTSSFTLSTSAGQKVTIEEASSTNYQKRASSASASAITAGESVLVLE
jgi:hypothetical protein